MVGGRAWFGYYDPAVGAVVVDADDDDDAAAGANRGRKIKKFLGYSRSIMKFFIITLLTVMTIYIKKATSDVLPNDLFSSIEVVELQMSSLQTNKKNNNLGIYQCWLFLPLHVEIVQNMHKIG